MAPMADDPYDPPSPESQALQSAFVKANKVKPCPSCGKDVGVWPFIKAAFSIRSSRVQCGNCGSWLHCQGTTGSVFQGMQMLMLGMAGGRAAVLRFTNNWRSAGEMVLLGILLLAVFLLCLAPYVRKESSLALIKTDVT